MSLPEPIMFTSKEEQRKHWLKHVKLGKKAVSDIRSNWLRLAEYAALVSGAYIAGLNINKNANICRRYAEEVGVNYQELSKWIKVKYAIVDKVEIPETKLLKEYNKASLTKAVGKVKLADSKEQIIEKLKEAKAQTPGIGRASSALAKMRSLSRYLLTDSSKLTISQLQTIEDTCKELLKLTRRELRKYNRKDKIA